MANKIRLLCNLPIDKKHGAKKGAEFEIVREKQQTRAMGGNLIYFIGLHGIECAAFDRECEYID